jgi:hypothetical protein
MGHLFIRTLRQWNADPAPGRRPVFLSLVHDFLLCAIYDPTHVALDRRCGLCGRVPVAVDPDRIRRNDHDEEMVIKLGSIGGRETAGAEMAG